MELIFLGTGGGRFNLIKQICATGGFRINSKSANIHVDPGPGALIHTLRLGLKPESLDAIVVTHYHVDHVTDANVLVEAMAKSTLKKGGILIGSKNTLVGDDEGDRGVTLYHQRLVGEKYVATWGEKKTFRTKKGEFTVEIIMTKHDEKSCFGFKLMIDGMTIGYTSDTEYYEGISEAYKGCDYLILNCLKPEPDQYRGHLTAEDVIKILTVARPRQAILSHMGMKLIAKKGVADSHAKRIETRSGVKTIAAKDGLRIVL